MPSLNSVAGVAMDLVPQFSTQALANSAWAFAQLELEPRKLLEMIQVQAMNPDLIQRSQGNNEAFVRSFPYEVLIDSVSLWLHRYFVGCHACVVLFFLVFPVVHQGLSTFRPPLIG